MEWVGHGGERLGEKRRETESSSSCAWDSLSLSRFFSFVSKSTCGSLPPSLPPSPQWKISSQVCKKEFHQKMKEKHTQEKESRDCTSPKAAVFKNTRNNDFPTQSKKKKNQSTQQKFKPRILVFFFKITEKREREGGRQRAAKTATRTMRSPREKQRQEKASSSSSSFFSFLNPLFWEGWKMMSLANLEREKWAPTEWRRWNEFPNSQQKLFGRREKNAWVFKRLLLLLLQSEKVRWRRSDGRRRGGERRRVSWRRMRRSARRACSLLSPPAAPNHTRFGLINHTLITL